jgi:DNA-binding MarR family transcriptional regulator
MTETDVRSEPVSFHDHLYREQAAFRHALRRFLRFSEEQARSYGVTPQQHIVLLSVRGEPSYPRVTVGDVAEAMQMRHHSASLLVDRCVKRGLIDRKENPEDRRRVMLSLTPEGQKILDEITRANRDELHALNLDVFYKSVREALNVEWATNDAE